jgi:hypothetical protein
MEQELGEMHWKDGWTFKRLDDGSVQIRATFGTHEGVQQPLRVKAIIPAAEWVSIIQHLGSEQTAEGFERARALHGGVLGAPAEIAVPRDSELENVLEAIIFASDGCVGHRQCAHSMEPWQRARALLQGKWEVECDPRREWPPRMDYPHRAAPSRPVAKDME